MLGVSQISFSTPEWLINFYHVTTIFSLLINSLGIYLILFQSGKIDSFKYFLLWFTMCCLLVDVFLFFLAQPVPLLPIWGGYIHGPFWNVFRISCHHASVVCGFLVGQQFAALTMCFVRKYQAISRIDTSTELSDSAVLHTSLFTQLLVSVWIVLYYCTGIDRPTAIGIIKSHYPSLLDKFLELEDFQIYIPDRVTVLFLFMAAFTATAFVAIIVFSTVQMLKLLQNLERHVSSSHLKKHKSAVTSLVAQVSRTIETMAVIPPISCGVLLFFESTHMQEMCWVMLSVSSCHGTLNCLVMILTYSPYRKYVKTKFCLSAERSQF